MGSRQVGEHLSSVVNLKEGIFSVTEKRNSKLMSKLEFISKVIQPTARALESWAGCITSMLLSVRPVAHMCSCAMYSDIRETSSCDQYISLYSKTSAEIEFWLTTLASIMLSLFGQHLQSLGVLTFSNTTDFAWGGYLVKIGKNNSKGIFSEAETDSSSTWRELKATLYVLEFSVASLTNKTVKHRSDNQAVPLVLTSGSKKPHNHKLVLDIFELCIKNSINLIPEWIPRDMNIISDFASKNVDVDDIMLHPDILQPWIFYGDHIPLTV